MADQTFQEALDAFFAAGTNAAQHVEQPAPVAAAKTVKQQRGECEDCGKTFKHRSSLREHRRQHTGEMPFACPHPGCDFRFKWRSSLSNHKRYHAEAGTSKPAAENKRGRARKPRAMHTTPVVEEVSVPTTPDVSKWQHSAQDEVQLWEPMELENVWNQIQFGCFSETSEQSDTASHLYESLDNPFQLF